MQDSITFTDHECIALLYLSIWFSPYWSSTTCKSKGNLKLVVICLVFPVKLRITAHFHSWSPSPSHLDKTEINVTISKLTGKLRPISREWNPLHSGDYPHPEDKWLKWPALPRVKAKLYHCPLECKDCFWDYILGSLNWGTWREEKVMCVW